MLVILNWIFFSKLNFKDDQKVSVLSEFFWNKITVSRIILKNNRHYNIKNPKMSNLNESSSFLSTSLSPPTPL